MWRVYFLPYKTAIMKLKTLTDEELREEILWRKIDAMEREVEPRYDGQPKEEQTREYHELHELYTKYWNEAHRRGLVPLSSTEAENEAVLEKEKEKK